MIPASFSSDELRSGAGAFSGQPESVSACFREGCAAEAVTPRDGKWRVPQSQPYLIPPVNVTSIYVEAVAASGARLARTLPMETESNGEFGEGVMHDEQDEPLDGLVRFAPCPGKLRDGCWRIKHQPRNVGPLACIGARSEGRRRHRALLRRPAHRAVDRIGKSAFHTLGYQAARNSDTGRRRPDC